MVCMNGIGLLGRESGAKLGLRKTGQESGGGGGERHGRGRADVRHRRDGLDVGRPRRQPAGRACSLESRFGAEGTTALAPVNLLDSRGSAGAVGRRVRTRGRAVS